jgi:glucose-1-phosphate adenylyltransferase
LLETLDQLASKDQELKDFGHQLLPHLVERGHAWAYPLKGYWQDVGTIATYWRTHQDLLRSEPPIRLDDPAWALRTHAPTRLPARIDAGAVVENSLIAPGCLIAGRVHNSVLGQGTIVEAGAVVDSSVLFDEVIVERDACIASAIVDSRSKIGAGATVGRAARPEGDDDRLDELLAVVGMGARVAAGSAVAPGARIKPAEPNGIEH